MAPRRRIPDPLGAIVGARIRVLRQEAGLTLQELAEESNFGTKPWLADTETGHVTPSLNKLDLLAERLGVELFDLLVFAEIDRRTQLTKTIQRDRHLLADLARTMTGPQLKKLLKDAKAVAS